MDTYTTASGEKKVYKGIKYCCPNRARKRGECDGMTQYLAKRVDDAVLEVIHIALGKIKEKAKDEAVKSRYAAEVKIKKDAYNALLKQFQKEQDILAKLIDEVGKALIGESNFTVDLLNQSITSSKKMSLLEAKIPVALKEYTDEESILNNLDNYYSKFKG